MFLVDVSPSMGKTRLVHLPDGPDGEERSVETTNLQWSLQFVKLKIQEMVPPTFVLTNSLLKCRALDLQWQKDGPVRRHFVRYRRCDPVAFPPSHTISTLVLDTENTINDKDGGYDHVTEFIPIGQPNAGTLAKLSALEASTEVGDRKCNFPRSL